MLRLEAAPKQGEKPIETPAPTKKVDNYGGASESGEPPPTEDGFTAMSELSSESILAIPDLRITSDIENRKKLYRWPAPAWDATR